MNSGPYRRHTHRPPERWAETGRPMAATGPSLHRTSLFTPGFEKSLASRTWGRQHVPVRGAMSNSEQILLVWSRLCGHVRRIRRSAEFRHNTQSADVYTNSERTGRSAATLVRLTHPERPELIHKGRY